MAESSTILRGTVHTNQGSKNVKFIIGGGLILLLIGWLIVSSVRSAGAYYREVGEVLDQQTTLTGKSLRVSGNVVPGSVLYDAPTLSLSFKIADPADASRQLPVHFHGVKPDQIEREGAVAIIEGKLGSDGTVEANNLLLKCPSRYDQYEEVKVEAVK